MTRVIQALAADARRCGRFSALVCVLTGARRAETHNDVQSDARSGLVKTMKQQCAADSSILSVGGSDVDPGAASSL